MWKKGTGIINEYEWKKSYILFPYFILVLINECTSKNQPHHKGMLRVAANGTHIARAYTDFRACLHENGGPRVGGVTCLSIQHAKKIIFTACHSGKPKLAFTSPDIISTSPNNFLTSRIDFTVLLLFEFLKKHHLPVGQVKNRIH